MLPDNVEDDDVLVLNGKRFVKEARYAKDRNVVQRTIARRRDKGMPFLDWDGFIWIPEIEGDAFLVASVKRRSPPRRSRRPRRQVRHENRDTA
jgi:hypothetical protein